MRETFIFNRTVLQRSIILCLLISLWLVTPSYTQTCQRTPLAPPAGPTITVSTVSELVQATNQANSAGNVTILLEDGTYQLNSMLWISGNKITYRSLSGNRDRVTIRGQGMSGGVSHIFNVVGDNFVVADITIGLVANHAVQIHSDADSPIFQNVRFFDTGEQMLKGSLDNSNRSDNGLVEWCLFEYPAGVGPQYYIGGIDVHQGNGWVVRNNTFKNIRSPGGELAEHAIHFWSGSQNTLVENNVIVNSDRGIGFGLGSSGHVGGMIRNNMVYTTRDVGIGLENASNVMVYNNTVFTAKYHNSIEYRFSKTQGARIINNLTNASIARRDGAGTATLIANVMNAQSSWFVNVAAGDLHLTSPISSVVDQGQALPEVLKDIDCENRPQGAAYDIGADEAGGDVPDSDGDGVPDVLDNCPTTPNPDQQDSDGDGVGDSCESCPQDPNKLQPGSCGCGVPDTDSDGDGTPNCADLCPTDPNKIEPGSCGCGVADLDSDNDGTPDCADFCSSDPNKVDPGTCGCGVPDIDSDGDGTPDCADLCPADLTKLEPGTCGCGVPDVDSDGDGTPDCVDLCAADPNKVEPGTCGCGIQDTPGCGTVPDDLDQDGVPDISDNCPGIANPEQGDADDDGIGDVCDVPEGEVLLRKIQNIAIDRGQEGSTPYVYRGDTLTYDITVQNLFDSPMAFVISDALSSLVKYVAGTFRVNGTNVGDGYVSTSGFLQYEASSVGINESVTIAFDVIVDAEASYATMIGNTAMITAYAPWLETPQVIDQTSNTVYAQVKDAVEPVPEPSTIALFGLGLLSIGTIIRKRR